MVRLMLTTSLVGAIDTAFGCVADASVAAGGTMNNVLVWYVK